MYQASFKKELNRLYTIRWIAQHTYGKEHISWKSKLELRDMVKGLDIKVPEIYSTHNSVEEIPEPQLDKFVIKPVKGAASRGVHPLIRKGKGYYHAIARKDTTWNKVIQRLKTETGYKPPFYIEQFIGSELPYNWEIYCFDGEVGLVRQRENLPKTVKRYKFWDTDFNDLGLIEPAKKDILNPELPLPYHPEELLKTASLISKNIPYIFCRVDLFDTPYGVYYGELTMHPGIGNNFIPEIDKQLGSLYLKAEARRT